MRIFAAQRLPVCHQPVVMLGSHGNYYQSHFLPPQWCYLQTHMIGRCFHSLIERQGLMRRGVPLRPSPLLYGPGSLRLLSEGNIFAYKVTLIKSSFSRKILKCQIRPSVGEWAIMVSVFVCLFVLQKYYSISSCPSLSRLSAFPSVPHIQNLSLTLRIKRD